MANWVILVEFNNKGIIYKRVGKVEGQSEEIE